MPNKSFYRSNRQGLSAAILSLLLVTACSAPPTAPVSTAAVPSDLETTIWVTPLPVTVVPALTSPLPVPATDLGVVIGQVFNLAGTRVVSNTRVYLGPVFRTADGNGVFTLESSTSPKGFTDVEGRFIIKDVPPGEYILAVGEIGGTRMPSVAMHSPSEVKAFTVRPGVVINLGSVRVDYLDR